MANPYSASGAAKSGGQTAANAVGNAAGMQQVMDRVQTSYKAMTQPFLADGTAYNHLNARNALYNRATLLGGALLPTLAPGLAEINQGDVAQGVGRMGLGAASAAGAQAVVGNMLKTANPLVRVLGAGAAALGGGMIGGGLGAAGGGMVDDAVGSITGRGTSEGAERKRSEKNVRQAAENLRILQAAGLEAPVAAQKDLMSYAMNQRIEETQRMAPIIRQQLNEQLVRQQALNASNAQNYMNMGVVATAGKIATGAQEQAGANYRESIRSNPYANNVLQAPNISFG
jgi:hypothetical protein